MQPTLYPIAYSGFTQKSLDDFLQYSIPIPLYSSEPAYLGTTLSTSASIGYDGLNSIFLKIDDFWYIGNQSYPWLLRINDNDRYSDCGYVHWGAPFNWRLSTDICIIDPLVRMRQEKAFFLCSTNSNGGYPMLVAFDPISKFFERDVSTFYLFNTTPDLIQWINNPISHDEEILLMYSGKLYTIKIPNTPNAYPYISVPLNVPELAGTAIGMTSTINIVGSKVSALFYYQGTTLCYVYTTSSSTVFMHYDDDLHKFIVDLSFGFAPYSGLLFYSQYNNCINFLYQDLAFIGDYRWYVVTPKSNLYSYFQLNTLSSVIRDTTSGYNRIIYIKEVNDQLTIYYTNTDGNSTYRLSTYSFTLPILSSILFNVNLGRNFSAIENGILTMDGDIFSGDFQWEVSSKTSYNVYQGTPELTITTASMVNLRVNASIPGYLNNITFIPNDFSNYTYEQVDEEGKVIKVNFLYSEIKDYNTLHLAINPNLVSPFFQLHAGTRYIRHCTHNVDSFCTANREEYKTNNCNTNCPNYVKNIIDVDIQNNGQDIEAFIYDERDNFAPFEQFVSLDIRFGF